MATADRIPQGAPARPARPARPIYISGRVRALLLLAVVVALAAVF